MNRVLFLVYLKRYYKRIALIFTNLKTKNMKKLVLFFLVAVSAGAYARNVSVSGNMKSDGYSESTTVAGANVSDGFTLKDGKMMTVNDGKFTVMNRDVTLSDGTKVMTTGYYMKKGGPKTELKEGEHIDLDGNVTTPDETTNPKTLPDKNMNDSTKSKY